MPALDLTEWFDNHIVYINKTTRPYLRQSIVLVNVGRSIQAQFGADLRDGKKGSDLQKAIGYVSEALKAATNTDVRYVRNSVVDETFKKAKEEIHKFCTKYNIILDESIDEPFKEDQKATSYLQAAKKFAEKAVKIAVSRESTTFLVTFWPPDVQDLKDERTILEFTVENGVKLEHFLARILQKSFEKKNGLPYVNLIQNPGFFTRVPLTLKDFSEKNGECLARHKHQIEVPTLCQLGSQKEINGKMRELHLLLDPLVLPESDLTTIFDDEQRKDIKRNYRNIWRLNEMATYVAAREISGCLVRLDPKKPLPLLIPRPEPPRLPTTPQQRPQFTQPTRETQRPRQPIPKEPIQPKEPQKSSAKTGLLGRLIPQTLRRTDPSPPKFEAPPPDPEPSSDIYLSRNAMGRIRLEMVPVVDPPKTRWPFKRS